MPSRATAKFENEATGNRSMKNARRAWLIVGFWRGEVKAILDSCYEMDGDTEDERPEVVPRACRRNLRPSERKRQRPRVEEDLLAGRLERARNFGVAQRKEARAERCPY